MTDWGERVIGLGVPPPAPSRSEQKQPGSKLVGASVADLEDEETALLIAAAWKLAVVVGYRKLTPARISATAGLATTAFKRHFDGVEAVHLEVARRLATRLFASGFDTPAAGRLSSRALVAGICRRVAEDPVASKVVLLDILEPGRGGVTCKAALVSRIAAAWSAGGPSSQDEKSTVEVTVAALWEVLARELAQSRVGHLQATAPALAHLFSATRGPAAPRRQG